MGKYDIHADVHSFMKKCSFVRMTFNFVILTSLCIAYSLYKERLLKFVKKLKNKSCHI